MAKKFKHERSTPPALLSPPAKVETKAPLPAYIPPPKPDVSHLPLLEASQLPPTVLLQTLAKALTVRRDHESVTEAEFVGWLVNRLPVTMIDAGGNVHVDIRHHQHQATMFTSHTDSVHNGGGHNKVRVDGKYWRADGAALGADDGSGIALMCHMIERGVPGYYIFFRGEERGGVGSSWLADNMPHLVSQFDRAVAFDRAGYSDVITHQSRGRCCSDAFAEALSNALCDQGQLYMPCDSGVYTDTAEFTRLIPECTNLSVGYKNQHGDREEQDVEFLIKLADSLVQIDWDALPTVRDPKVHEARKYDTRWYTDTWPKSMQTTSPHGNWPDTDDKDDKDIFGDDEVTAMRKMRDYYNGLEDLDEVDEEDRDNDTGLSGEELDLYVAVDEATRGKFTELMELLADYIYPEDTTLALRQLSRGKLTDEVLEDALVSLELGFVADSVKSQLVDACSY